MAFKRVPLWVVTLGQQYNVGEKPTGLLYTYINHHTQPPIITTVVVHSYEDDIMSIIIVPCIEPYKNNRG